MKTVYTSPGRVYSANASADVCANAILRPGDTPVMGACGLCNVG